ncbi:MAG: isoprenylcysteine carboxylmethyltransferase family protein [Candidatus Eremiobacteraeota bacterium]|nr:isoprenylcysteine carboxylmethyltransferase family protein [Candidatus Eremiobacteraeota bacterium]
MTFQAFVFKNRGLLLALPAVVLARCGRPSASSIAAGLPFALAGELIRCWAVGYSGVTTRSDTVTAPKLVTAGPYAHVRNPLYLGNFITAAGFAVAFTGKNSRAARRALVFGSLAVMAAAYAAIIPHEEAFLRERFGKTFERYCERVPRIVPQLEPLSDGEGQWQADAVLAAESKTFVTFGAMLVTLLARARR